MKVPVEPAIDLEVVGRVFHGEKPIFLRCSVCCEADTFSGVTEMTSSGTRDVKILIYFLLNHKPFSYNPRISYVAASKRRTSNVSL